MQEISVESMLPDTRLTATTDINSQGLTVADQRRMIVHYAAEMVHQVLTMGGANPLGLIVTTELVEDPTKGAPRIRVSASTPKYAGLDFLDKL